MNHLSLCLYLYLCLCLCPFISLSLSFSLQDHRNASLREWIVDTHMLGPTGLGSPYIDGFNLDDQWFNTSQNVRPWEPKKGFCDHSPIGGATEENPHCTEDMGLTQQDTTDITNGWQLTMQAVFEALIANKGFSWTQFYNSGAPPQSSCTAWFESACSVNSMEYTSAMMFQYTKNSDGHASPLPQFEIDLASFLLVRGPYAVPSCIFLN